MTLRAPSLWGSGVRWGPTTTPERTAYWGPESVAPTGRPHVFVTLGGVLQMGLRSGSWRMGRADWFDVLSPSQASFRFTGTVDAEINDAVMVSTETGALWVGTVDAITEEQVVDGAIWTTVTATDIIGTLGKAVSILGSVGISPDFHPFYPISGTLDDVTRDYLADYGDASGSRFEVVVGDSAGSLPTLGNWVDPPADTSLLQILNTAERSSNAMMTLQSDGSLLIVMRDYLVAGSVEVIDLSGADAPYGWSKVTDRPSIINHWVLTQPAYGATFSYDSSDATSIALYGDHTYAVSDYLCGTAAHFTAGMRAAMALPRAIVTSGQFHITDQTQHVLHLQPLSWVSFQGDTWQVMSIEHSFGDNAWDVTITADVSQNAMAGVTEPTPTDPPGTTIDTQTLTSAKSATAFKSSGGSFYGNGAGDYLPVGYYSSTRTRVFIDWTTLSWPAGFIRVKKATLNLRTTGQVWATFGSKPKVYAQRIKESWSEGTYNAAAPSQYSASNALVWPGPSRATSGQTLKTLGTSENNDVSIDVTDILQAAHDAGHFYGIALVSAGEDSHTNTIEFYSDDHATSGFRPELVVVCETT